MIEESSESQKPLIVYPMGRRTIGRYELLHPLATGGMAAVFLGRLRGLAGFERLVAIKVIHPHLANKKEFVEMFLDEARLSAKIHHPNVVEIFEVSEDSGLYFMVAELVAGKSLDLLLQSLNQVGRKLEPRLYLTLVAKVCDALDAAHTLTGQDGTPLNLVHRDVSPSNILISYNGLVKLIDFGIAFARERLTTTKSGVVKGKYGYMAPEQWMTRPVDGRTDLFALGIILYLLATEKHPFPGENQAECIQSLLHRDPKPPRAIVKNIDPRLENIILKCLCKEPEGRYQTARELRQDLKKHLAPLGGALDRTVVADLMNEIYSQEIAEHRQLLRKISETENNHNKETPQSADDFPDNKLPTIQKESAEEHLSDDKQLVHHLEDKPPPDGTHTDNGEPSPTVRYDYLDGYSKSLWKQRLGFLLLGACGLAVAGYALHTRFLKPTQPADTVPLVKVVPGADAQLPIPRSQDPDQQISPTGDNTSREPSAKEDLPAETVTLRLIGLPESAQVTLNDKVLSVSDDKIIVATAPTKQRLQVTAPEYQTYSKMISLKTDGDLVLDIQKKEANVKKAIIKKGRNRNTEPGLMECPYPHK